MINFEMLVYTSSYSLFTYIVLEFVFKPSGELDSAIFYYSDNPKNRLRWQQITLFSVWLTFSLYYMILLIRKVVLQWRKITEEQNKDKEIVHRSRCSKFLLWIGIDNKQLTHTNPVAMIVLSIVMIIKHMIMTFVKFIRCVLRHCGSNVFNYFDILITYMTI
jgi:cellulose synthase/poly-beta-1,6-N-acetylglucosamine synthase-like glycosyltransferase